MNGFQSGAFQATGFQIVAVATEQPSGGYGFGAYDHQRRKRKELEDEIAALEQHLASEQKVSPETIRLKSRIRQHAMPLPPLARRAVQKAVRVQTVQAFQHAERALQRLEQEEEEDFAALILLALH